MSDPVVPDHVREAIRAGHVAEVVVFCDNCGAQECGDYIGATRQERLAGARRHLAGERGWRCDAGGDFCLGCLTEAQPAATGRTPKFEAIFHHMTVRYRPQGRVDRRRWQRAVRVARRTPVRAFNPIDLSPSRVQRRARRRQLRAVGRVCRRQAQVIGRAR